MAAPYDPSAPARHLMAAAPLIMQRKHWSKSERDRVELVELARGWRVDVIGEEDGKPVRRASAHERHRKYAEMLAADFATVTGFEIRRVLRRVAA